MAASTCARSTEHYTSSLPTDGPKTLNGLIVEHLQDIPEVGVGLRIGDVAMEIVQTQDRRIKTVRIRRSTATAG